MGVERIDQQKDLRKAGGWIICILSDVFKSGLSSSVLDKSGNKIPNIIDGDVLLADAVNV